ncbi:integrase, catalytic region, zinc finger, CCHC-type containing protein, partial [Tanacetum coccineum]
MLKSYPICLLSKASKIKSGLWHRHLSHLNFGTINQLAKEYLVRGLPKLKYEKDHLWYACSLGKSKKHSHKPKSENNLKYLHVFGALCYPTNDSEDLGKLKPKAGIGIFIGYSLAKKAYRVYNKRKRMIMETIHVEFDEMIAMDSERYGLGPEHNLLTFEYISSGLIQNPSSSTLYVPPSKKEWDILFQPFLT